MDFEIKFDRTVTQNLDAASSREWIESNGLGGWASGTISGANTRRYHGLLVAATKPPVGRMVMLSKLDEVIATADDQFELGCNFFPGAVAPQGYLHLRSFTKGLFPVFEFECGDIVLRKTVAAVNGQNTTLVLYEVLKAGKPFVLELRPYVAARDYHSTTHANGVINQNANCDESLMSVQPYEGVPQLFISVPGASYDNTPTWHYNFVYNEERERGLDSQEDLLVYGAFRKRLREGAQLGVIISTEKPTTEDAFALFEAERARRESLLEKMPSVPTVSDASKNGSATGQNGAGNVADMDALFARLLLASDQFVVRRGTDLNTVIAGYHWFTDWGRDTMIALPGLCLVTGRFDEARGILRAFAESVSDGMLPNCFPDSGEEPHYNTVDATLWFFVATYKYFQYSRDRAFLKSTIYPVLQDIIRWHEKGTRYGIKVDSDGLLSAGEPGVQLTWMDAKVGDWVVTPRSGKPVEINALWYNALMILSELTEKWGDAAEAKVLRDKAKKTKTAFQKQFWNAESSSLYDCLNGSAKDNSIRPNQLLALSLPFELLSTTQAEGVLSVVEELLRTPVGLRSLAPTDSQYRGVYHGDQLARDGAYHQGTVWSWLLGPYITALARYRPDQRVEQATKVLHDFSYHFEEAGVGTISEIFDGNAPHTPRGCIGQAWGVAEILRAYVEDVARFDVVGGVLKKPAKKTRAQPRNSASATA